MPGVFKKWTDQASLNYDVSLSARNAAALRGQFLNTANSISGAARQCGFGHLAGWRARSAWR